LTWEFLHATIPSVPTLLITGGAGFIGSSLVRHAIKRAQGSIVVVDKLTYAGSLVNLEGVLDDRRVIFLQADIGDRVAMEAVFRERRPEAVVNLAAETHVDRSIDSPAQFVETNVVGTCVLLDVARRFAATLDASAQSRFRFLHVSTDEVYGSLGATGSFTEETNYAPNSPYSASKASSDHFVRAYGSTYGLPVLIANPSNTYGPRQFPEKLIPLMTLNAVEGRPLPIYGDGSNVRDWLHVDDHCEGLMLILEKGRPGEKYHLGGESERSNLEVVDAICLALEELRPAHSNAALKGKRYRDLETFVPDRPGHDRRYAMNTAKIRNQLGWRPRHSFELGVRRTVEWYLDNREWCEAIQAGRYGRERLGLGR
jgi:dTDP-glucose 4,6-dehydratase